MHQVLNFFVWKAFQVSSQVKNLRLGKSKKDQFKVTGFLQIDLIIKAAL